MVWSCISTHGMGELHMCKGTIDAEAYTWISQSNAAIKLMSYLGPSVDISAGQRQAFISTFHCIFNKVPSVLEIGFALVQMKL